MTRQVTDRRSSVIAFPTLIALVLLLRVCATATPGATRLVAVIAVSMVLFGLTVFTVRVLWLGLCHLSLVRELDRSSRVSSPNGIVVHVIQGHGGPFVAGLWRPRVYCPEQTLSRLTSGELRAVLAHEQWHQCCYAPLQLLLLSGAAWPLSLVPVAQRRFDRWRAQLEIDADRHAIHAGNEPSQLASALLSIGQDATAAGAAAFAATSELRLRTLLGESQPEAAGRSAIVTTILISATAIACMAM